MKACLKKNKLLLAAAILFDVVSSAAYVYMAIILQKVTDVAISGDISAFRRVILSSVVYFLLLGAVNYGYSLCSKALIRRVILLLRRQVFCGILRRNARDFAGVNTADYLSAFTNDINLVEANYLQALLTALQNAAIFVAALTVLFTVNPLIALGLMACIALTLVVPGFFGKALQGRQDALSKKLSAFTSKIKDFLSGYEVVKSYNMDRPIKSEFDRQNNEATLARAGADRLLAANESLSEVLAYLTLFSSFFIGAYLIVLKSITVGTLLALIQLSSFSVNPVMALMQNLPKIQGIKPVLRRLDELADYEDVAFTGTAAPTFEDRISAEALGFSYNEGQAVVHDVSVSIQKNKKYAVAGPSGCGKTTLIHLLTGSYRGFEGKISYDGTDIRELDIERLRRMISVIHQNIYMFDDSILQNICLNEAFTDEELAGAIETSGVKQFLDRTPDGLCSPVGENGAALSGGQRQRVAVARAILRKRPLLVLDEGTSAIDMQTAYDIESRLLKLDNLTLITVTHKMSADLLGLYDRIIYMEDGCIAETGSLEELLARRGAFYRFFHLETADD